MYTVLPYLYYTIRVSEKKKKKIYLLLKLTKILSIHFTSRGGSSNDGIGPADEGGRASARGEERRRCRHTEGGEGAVTLARRGRGGGAGARREAAVHEKALAVACDVGGGCQGRAQWVVQVGPRKKPSPSKQRKP